MVKVEKVDRTVPIFEQDCISLSETAHETVIVEDLFRSSGSSTTKAHHERVCRAYMPIYMKRRGCELNVTKIDP